MLFLAAASAVYYRFYYMPSHQVPGEEAYVLPLSADVVDTTAELRNIIGTVKSGARVEVLGRTTNWVYIRMPGGLDGWVEAKDLLDASTYQRGRQLFESLRQAAPQAAGHADTVTNLHLDPSRDATVLAELPAEAKLDMFERRLVPRPGKSGAAAGETSAKEAWYLVRVGSRAGWVLGRLVDLDVPPAIAAYAEGVNMVGWRVLRTVEDGGTQVPEYLVADRMGDEDVDFNHIRVFTWWVKHHKYVTAYVEGDFNGYFPITVTDLTDANYFAKESPYFRLRLRDADGHQVQAVYGLFDTIVHRVGTVDGWESAAMPAPPPPEHRGNRRSRRPAKGRRARKRRG